MASNWRWNTAHEANPPTFGGSNPSTLIPKFMPPPCLGWTSTVVSRLHFAMRASRSCQMASFSPLSRRISCDS
jgi:hypothetical protein